MTDTTKQIEQERAPVAADAIRVASRLQSFADRLCNNTSLGEKYEGDETELRTAINMLRHFARATPVSPAPDQIETAAKAIYRLFDLSDIHPWVERGNSEMQTTARRYARAALEAAPAKPQSDLHSAIMNLPCQPKDRLSPGQLRGYAVGVHDMRHAAAELVAAAQGDNCRSCGGSGDVTTLSGGGPDAYEVDVTCPACSGTGEAACVGAQVAGEPFERAFQLIYAAYATPADGFSDYAGAYISMRGKVTEAFSIMQKLRAAPVPAPATVDRDAVLEEAAYALNQHMSGMPMAGSAVVMGCVRVIRELKGKAAPEEKAETLESSWSGDDGEALIHLAPNFTDTAGLLQPKAGYTPTAQDLAAINYLCSEWDYGYSPEPAATQGVEAQKGGANHG